MNIEDEARQEADKRFPELILAPENEQRADDFIEGAKWASEQAEALDRMGPAAGCHLCFGAGGYPDHDDRWVECSCQQVNREPEKDEGRTSPFTAADWAALDNGIRRR